jgi:hypothetical protein
MFYNYFLFLMAALLSLASQSFPAQAAEPLMQPGKQSLHRRVLTRPGAMLLPDPGAQEERLIDAFSRFYLYADEIRDGQRWLQVGVDTRGDTRGWVRADQTVPWKQQLTLGLTNPAAARDRLLFFRSREDLGQILAGENPAEIMSPLVRKIEQGGTDDRVVAIEPDRFVDINDQFYLLPILDFDALYTTAGHKLKTLKVASVTKQALPQETPKQAPSPVTPLESFRAAVVFVIDSTISMGPYIEETRKAVDRIFGRIKTAGVLDKVSFGLVAYRADIEQIPQLEYVAKELADPAEVADGDDFLSKIAALREARVSTAHFDEDAFAGIIKALEDIPWNQFGARYLVLVTDAGALQGDQSETGMNAERVQSEAGELGVAIFALHLKTPEGRPNHAGAEATYRSLTRNAYIQEPLYFPVETGSVKRFGVLVDTLADAIVDHVRRASRGETVAGSAKTSRAARQPAIPDDGDAELRKLRAVSKALGHAMQLAYLGKVEKTSAPRVLEGWIADRDLADPTKRTVDVRVLLTKNQLSDLEMILRKIVDAADRGVLEPSSFFDSLRSLAAQYGRDPNLATRPEATRLADLGILGEYLEGLPYQSDVMQLDQDTWSRWGPQRQYDFINRLRAKIQLYARYNADVGRWQALAEGSPVDEHVYPVRLQDLP